MVSRGQNKNDLSNGKEMYENGRGFIIMEEMCTYGR